MARCAAGRGGNHIFRRFLSHGEGRVIIKIEQFPELQPAGFGEFFEGGEADVALSAGFDRLIIFVTETGLFGERLLGEAKALPELFYARQQALSRVVCHDEE